MSAWCHYCKSVYTLYTLDSSADFPSLSGGFVLQCVCICFGLLILLIPCKQLVGCHLATSPGIACGNGHFPNQFLSLTLVKGPASIFANFVAHLGLVSYQAAGSSNSLVNMCRPTSSAARDRQQSGPASAGTSFDEGSLSNLSQFKRLFNCICSRLTLSRCDCHQRTQPALFFVFTTS